MKALKIILGIVGGLIVLALILGLFLPTDFNYERYTNINASKSTVFNQVNNVKAWEAWGPWMEDETIKVTYGETTVGQGAFYSWASENSGNGDLTIAESIADQSIKTNLNFEGGGPANGSWKFEDGEEGGTKVTWGMGFTMPYPINVMAIFSSEEDINGMFDKGLANIKKIAEAETDKTYRGYNISMIDFPETNFLSVRDKVNFDNIAAFYGNSYGKIGAGLAEAGLEMAGRPSGIFYEWDMENNVTDMAAVIAVKSGATVEGLDNIAVSESKALAIDYYGDYPGSAKAHYAMDDYMKENGIEQAALVLEEYVTDPGEEPDTAKWLTKVYYLIDK